MVVALRPSHLLALVVLVGCSKESLLRSALADPTDRKETMELTLKICDEHPEYVDDLFALARTHDVTFDRVVHQSAVALEDPEFAAQVAAKLAPHPHAVEIVTRAILAEAADDPELRRAIGAATLAEGDVIQKIVAENPQLMQQVMMRILANPTGP